MEILRFMGLHHMFDITQVNGIWAAYDVANVLAGRGSWGISPNIATMDMAPQAARSADGTKLFFTWSDNSNYTLGDPNQNPNLFGRAFDVSQNKWSPIKDFTSCSPSTNGLILFPHIAPEVLEPAINVYKIAGVYGEYTVPNDPLQISNFNFLNNLIFSINEFTVSNPSTIVNINQTSPLLICPSSTLYLSISGNYGQVLWSNGSIANVAAITSGTNTFYSVAAQQNCHVGVDTIWVNNMSNSTAISQSSICLGDSTQLSVTGNANAYVWNPGAQAGTLVAVSPSVSTIYTLSASGSSCVSTETIDLTIFQLPNISITGPDSVCVGQSVTYTANGASTYSWSFGAVGNISSITPTSNTSYTVTGFDTNLCGNSQSVSISLVSLPSPSVSSNRSVICVGESATLTALGAISYSWVSASSTNSNLIVSPSSTIIYTLSGMNSFGCEGLTQFTQSVSLCTWVTSLESENSRVLLFPNPNAGEFSVQGSSNTHLFLYNELGQLIEHKQLNSENSFQVDFKTISPGIYLLTWNTINGVQSKKVVVSH